MTRKQQLSLTPLRNSPGRKLYLAHSRMRHTLSNLFEAAGYSITTESWALLNYLWQEDPLTQRALAERMEKDGPFISRLVDALERDGYVRRRVSARDRRIREVALTERGRAAREPLMKIAEAFVKRVFSGVPSADLEAFMATLDHIISRLAPGNDARPTRRGRRSAAGDLSRRPQ